MEKLAKKITLWFKDNLILNEEQAEVIEYSIISLLLLLFNFFFLSFFCWIFGVLKLGVTAALTAVFFRSVTGGAHLSAPWRCMFISSLLPTVFGLVGKYISPNFPERWLILFLLCCFILNLILVQKFAPAEVKERPLRSEQKRRFKLLGLVFTGLWLMLVMLLVQFEHKDLVVASALGFLWQGVTLTPSGFHIYKQLSNLGTKKEGKVRS